MRLNKKIKTTRMEYFCKTIFSAKALNLMTSSEHKYSDSSKNWARKIIITLIIGKILFKMGYLHIAVIILRFIYIFFYIDADRMISSNRNIQTKSQFLVKDQTNDVVSSDNNLLGLSGQMSSSVLNNDFNSFRINSPASNNNIDE